MAMIKIGAEKVIKACIMKIKDIRNKHKSAVSRDVRSLKDLVDREMISKVTEIASIKDMAEYYCSTTIHHNKNMWIDQEDFDLLKEFL